MRLTCPILSTTLVWSRGDRILTAGQDCRQHWTKTRGTSYWGRNQPLPKKKLISILQSSNMNFLYNVHLCYSFSSNFCESCYWVIKSKVTYLIDTHKYYCRETSYLNTIAVSKWLQKFSKTSYYARFSLTYVSYKLGTKALHRGDRITGTGLRLVLWRAD